MVIRPFCFGQVRAARATVFISFGGWHLDVFLDASLDKTCDFAPWLLATPAAGADHGNSSSPSALLQLCPGRQDGPWQLGEGFRFRLTSQKSGAMMGDDFFIPCLWGKISYIIYMPMGPVLGMNAHKYQRFV